MARYTTGTWKGTRQSDIARLESGNYNPSLHFLQRVASALGKRLSISFR